MSNPTTLTRAAKRLALIICFVAVLAATSAAQTTQPPSQTRAPASAASPTPQPNATPAVAATDNHDLSITANVTARELLFEVVPNPKVEFTGRPRRDTVWEAERTNLPAQVQPGVTYRDIGIRLRITSIFADIERIVAEALGEIPASDDTPPQQNEPNATPPPQPGNATPPPQPDNAPTATTSDAPQANNANNAATTFATPTQTSRAAAAKTIPARRVPRPRGRP